jgi:hypothetical protein
MTLCKYECSKCGLSGVKLWRQYQTFLDNIELFCKECAEEDQGENLDVFSCEIAWLVPAIPTEENDTYWGYTSVPEDRVRWWKSLPVTRKGSN